MNKRTASILLTEDLIVLKCLYPPTQKVKDAYTFVSRASWLPGELEPGDRLIAQAGALKGYTTVAFAEYGDIEDLDLDALDRDYKFVLYAFPPEIAARHEETEERLKSTQNQIKKARVAGVRDALRAHLGFDPPPAPAALTEPAVKELDTPVEDAPTLIQDLFRLGVPIYKGRWEEWKEHELETLDDAAHAAKQLALRRLPARFRAGRRIEVWCAASTGVIWLPLTIKISLRKAFACMCSDTSLPSLITYLNGRYGQWAAFRSGNNVRRDQERVEYVLFNSQDS